MGQYKVPQNVESEDKLVGPLTMKQFIYALIGLGWGFIMWRVLSPGGSIAIIPMIISILPISGFMFLLAFGRREEQSFENYLIALIRFMVMPRRRTWMKDPAVLEAIVDAPPPPKPHEPTAEERQQVMSRLQQLALVVDTRGHTKPASVQLPDDQNKAATMSQRVFIEPTAQGDFVPSDVQVADDILATTNEGQHAQVVGELLQNKEQQIQDTARQNMIAAAQSGEGRAPITPTNITPQNSQPAVDNAILKKVMDTPDLSVAQVAQVANRGQLQPGQSVSIRPQ